MYKFIRNVSTMTGKNFATGMVVPDGIFGNLAEMVKAKDIEEIVEHVDPENVEPVEYDESDPDEMRKAENARKARERRAAAKEGK
jgi:hypothetical protein